MLYRTAIENTWFFAAAAAAAGAAAIPAVAAAAEVVTYGNPSTTNVTLVLAIKRLLSEH